ncbi:unnamed protein product, partial [Pylaiella littoralis]
MHTIRYYHQRQKTCHTTASSTPRFLSVYLRVLLPRTLSCRLIAKQILRSIFGFEIQHQTSSGFGDWGAGLSFSFFNFFFSFCCVKSECLCRQLLSHPRLSWLTSHS